MTVLFCGSTGEAITLTNQIASGGEGTVWQTNRNGYLAKVYQPPNHERVEKLKVMVAYPPQEPNLHLKHISFAWPKSLLIDNNGWVLGFLMPNITESVELLNVYNPKLRQKLGLEIDWYFLHTIAQNIASIIQAIHSKGYVLGDIKPQNILVNNRALPSIIDTDSFQVRHPHNGQVYRCLVGSEGFTPLELLDQDLATIEQTEVHDHFRLAVIIYLLLFGEKPFKGLWTGTGDSPEPTELFRRGFWPYAQSSLIKPGPLTIPLNIVHPEIQQCFLRCFNEGHTQPHLRPTSKEWKNALEAARNELIPCSHITNHYYSKNFGKCHWCERAKKIGFDNFLGVPIPQSTVITTQSESKIYVANNISKLLTNIGKQIIVIGQVFSTVDNTKNTPKPAFYIHFHNPTSFNCAYGIFRIVISSQGLYKLNKFQSITIDELKRLKGQYITITGVIDIYKTKKRCFTQIILEEPAQLELITPETAKKLISQAFNQLSPQSQSSKSSSQSFTNTQLTQPSNQQSSKATSNNNPNQYSPQAINLTQNYYQQGLKCAKNRNYNQAIQFYDRGLALNHNDFLLYRSRGYAYYKLKNYINAHRDYKEALRLRPQDANTEYMFNKVSEKFKT